MNENNKQSTPITIPSYVTWVEKNGCISFLKKPVTGCGVLSSFERMCQGMICLQMAVFSCASVCAFLCLATHVSWACCKVMSLSLQTTAVM